MTEIKLYTTAGCHLCEQAHDLLLQLSQHHAIHISPIEIGDDDALVEQFGVHIPVLAFDTGQHLYWPFDLPDIEQHLLSS